MEHLAVFFEGLNRPVVIIRGPHLVGIPVLENPADADDKNGRGDFPDHLGLALFARQVGVAVENFLGMEELKLLGEIRILAGLQRRELLLGVLGGTVEDLPDLFHDVFQKVEVAILLGDNPLPIPLVYVG